MSARYEVRRTALSNPKWQVTNVEGLTISTFRSKAVAQEFANQLNARERT